MQKRTLPYEKRKKYNYFYRIENKIKEYYYGIHSTNNLNDMKVKIKC